MDKFDMGIKYEVALEVLGQRRQPIMQALQKEEAKEKPCEKIIEYYQMRITALDILQHQLLGTDFSTVLQIIDPEAEFEIS